MNQIPFQAISDNATRREQEAVAAQRRAMREAEEELKRKMAANGGKSRSARNCELWRDSPNLFHLLSSLKFLKVERRKEGRRKNEC